VYHNCSEGELYELCTTSPLPADPMTRKSAINNQGALVSYTGVVDYKQNVERRVVKHRSTADEIWWGPSNIPAGIKIWNSVWERACNFLSTRPKLYVVDGYAGWEPEYRIPVRIITARTYHALYATNLLVQDEPHIMERDFSEGAEFHIVDCGEFPSNMQMDDSVAEAMVV
jgi:phosphoenolpyruvate carboxykinase (ATP)